MSLAPSLEFALHPYWPERLGFRTALRTVNSKSADLLDRTDPYTLVTARGRTTLMREVSRVLRNGVPGDIVEFGVFRGGTAAVLGQMIKDDPSRHLHLFDRWGDLPEPTEQDGHRKQQYSRSAIPEKIEDQKGTLDSTKQVVEKVIGFPGDRVHYYQGWYEDTLPKYPGSPIAFASVDCDYYESVKAVLAVCDRYASPGASFVSDDYGTWPGAKQAIDEWLATTKRDVEMIRLHRIGTAVLRIKS
jgi:hypothetical protein